MSGASHMVLSVFLIGSWSSWLEAPNGQVAKGNERFEAGEFDAALESYRAAAGDTRDPAAVRFDEGAALYRLAEAEAEPVAKAELFAQAEQAFRRAAEARDPQLKSAAYYNLGNALYQGENWDEAARAYKKALVANPQHDNARYNLELTQRQRHRDGPPQDGQGGQGPPQPGQGGDPDQGDQQDGDQGGQQGDEQGDQATAQGQGETPESEGSAEPGQDGEGQGGDQPQDLGADSNAGGEPQGQNQGEPGEQDGDQGDGDQGDEPTDRNRSGDGQSGDADAPSEVDRKLDALERSSRELRHGKLRGRATETGRGKPIKDW